MRLSLPYPHKALWPNGRPHWGAKSRETKKHRQWAYIAAKADELPAIGDGQIPIKIVVYGKSRGPLPDEDNSSAAAKAYLDGIAEAIGVNDRHFSAPVIEFSTNRASKFVIYVGECARTKAGRNAVARQTDPDHPTLNGSVK
jgi:hypothetical protein